MNVFMGGMVSVDAPAELFGKLYDGESDTDFDSDRDDDNQGHPTPTKQIDQQLDETPAKSGR
jgi:hypothetical protein